MRFGLRRLLGASTLALFFSLGVAGCSGGQQDDDGLDVSDNQAADNNAAGDNNAAADDNAAGDNAADNNATADAGGDDTAGNATADAGDGAAAGGNATENDLQEIITEMNGQQGADGAAPAGGENQALPQDQAAQNPAANAAAPANAAAANAAPANAAPANAAATNAAPAAPTAAASSALPFQPGGTPAAAGLPEMGSKMAYIVEKGDTLAKISQKVYGTNGRWQEMATLSGLTNPSRIFPGDLVYYTLDESALTFAKAYDSIPRSEEQVKPGDTLASIAQRLYGSTTEWRSIWRHNDKIDNPDVVTPGTTVYYVPKGAVSAAVHKAKAELVKLANKSTVKTVIGKHLATKTHNSKQPKIVVGQTTNDTAVNLTGSHIQINLSFFAGNA